jgi:hypothetical protein
LIRLLQKLAICAAILFAATKPAFAEEFILPLYDDDDKFFENLLGAALNKADGDHSLRTYNLRLPQSRVMRALLDDQAPVNVLFTGHSIEREGLLRQIDIPLSRGLLGYRVMVINTGDEKKFNNIKTLAELVKKITLGSGTSWPDTVILRAAGFQVKTSTIDNLWPMLAHRRFNALPRGMSEIQAEMQNYPPQLPDADLTTENTLMIGYRFDHFFYLAPNDKTRADIIEQGLKRIYETGEFMRIFESDPAIQKALADQRKHKRKVFMLPNPLNSERVNNIPKKYWHSFE